MRIRQFALWRINLHPAGFIIKWIIALLSLIAFILMMHQINLATYFPIKIVRVYGINHLDPNEVKTLLQPLLQRGFFGVHLEEMRERLLQLPWSNDISVRREWPDKIEIKILEKLPIARWDRFENREIKDKSKKLLLLSKEGEVFSPGGDLGKISLPLLVGPEGQQILMLQYFNKINRLFEPLNTKIAYLELTPYLTWKLTCTNGMTIRIGHKDVLTRVRHFVKVYPKIVGMHAKDVDYIDLRYPNGMAVKWKDRFKTSFS